jgi:hypothetical protein
MRPEQRQTALQFADRAVQVAKSVSDADGIELTAIAGHFMRLKGKSRTTAFRRVRTHEGKPKK